LESFDLATIHHFQSEGIDNISSTWLKQIFFYSKEINKMLKRVLWMDIPSLIENGVSPKLNFGSLVGLSSFW
jgi:phosphopantetheine adenylyltransferase